MGVRGDRPSAQDGHFLTALRYVLRNPVRAGLVEHAMDWPWSSLRFQQLRDPLPVEAPIEWLQWIDQPLFDHDLSRSALASTGTAIRKGRPASEHCNDAGLGIHAAEA